MNIERWQQLKELLHRALELPPDRRAGFLDGACAADSAMRIELESLLLAGENVPPAFLQSTPWDHVDFAAGTLQPGQTFARHFHLISKLGEGGMGQVWLAEQTSPVTRQVALKLIKAGMYDDAVEQRFRSELQSLAIMDHPAIAKVFDAGTTAQDGISSRSMSCCGAAIGGAAEPELENQRGPGYIRGDSLFALHRAEATREVAARRPRCDHGQGARAGPRSALWHTFGTGRGHSALPAT